MAKNSESDPECCGFSKVNSQGQMLIPVEARTALQLEAGTRLMVFADREARWLVVTIKPLDQDLLELASRAAPNTPG